MNTDFSKLSSLREAEPTAYDEILKAFNTAIVSTRIEHHRDYGAELESAMENPAFRAILRAISDLALQQNLSFRESAERVVESFRKVDQIWKDYIYQEGVDRLKNPGSQSG